MMDIVNTNIQEMEDTMVLEEHSTGYKAELIVYNDDYNTFDWVIKCFMEVCNHTFIQSEQLSLLVHFKGKATVKTGAFEDLRPLKDALVERGLSAVIETFAE